MVAMSTSDARDRFEDLINRVRSLKERIVVGPESDPAAALVPIEDLRMLEALEDERDAAIAEERLNTPAGYVAWDEVKKQFGF